MAQAIHWFNFKAFYQEVYRVSKPNSLVAIWDYGLIQFNKPINKIIWRFYKEVIGPYWYPERQYIDQAYQTIPFDFPEIRVTENFSIKQNFTLSELGGHLNT